MSDLEITIERIGGLGIHLVRSVMDDVAYSRRNGRNVVLMKKAVR